MANKTQLFIIGAGPAGYPAAFLAADLGMQVTLVDEKPQPGGTCLFEGCIPSKALLHAAKIISESKEAESLGITFGEPAIDLDNLRSYKENVVTKLTSGLGQLSKLRKVNYMEGTASFESSNSAMITKPDGSKETIEFEKAIIATGAKPIMLPNLPGSPRIMDSTAALKIAEIPKSLLLVGGGYIGLELGCVYASLGSSVTLIEMTDDILLGTDKDLKDILKKRLKKTLKSILLNTKVVNIVESTNGLKVTYENKDGSKTEEFDKALIAIGRYANTQQLKLENTNVDCNDKGFINIDSHGLTKDASIYAMGDVTGGLLLAHKATHQGRDCIENIAGKDACFNPKAIPAVIFTDPEIATCGLSETEAQQKGIDYTIAKFPWVASGRAITLNRTDGLTKLIIDSQSNKILGVGIVGAGAGELIAEGALAVEHELTVDKLKSIIHPHPTVSETIMEAAESYFGTATHIFKPKR